MFFFRIMIGFAFFFCLSCSTLNKEGVKLISRYTIESDDLPPAFDGFTITFLSDTHYPSILKREGLDVLVQQINALSSDLIILGGDYTEYNKNILMHIDEIADKFQKLNAPFGVYAVLGNHDYFNGFEETLAALKRNNINVLLNSATWLYKDNQRIYLGGVGDHYFKDADILPIIQEGNVQPQDFFLLVSHNPDFAENSKQELVDLTLSGHTHGGQVRIFGWAPAASIRYKNKYLYGLKTTPYDQPIIITQGIGTSRVKIRIGAPSEIVVITLKQKQPS